MFMSNRDMPSLINICITSCNIEFYWSEYQLFLVIEISMHTILNTWYMARAWYRLMHGKNEMHDIHDFHTKKESMHLFK